MKSDPMDNVNVTTITTPPSQGPGSGKAAWVSFARDSAETCTNLWGIVDDQTAAIHDLQAEIELLRNQIETRKPKGGRPRIDDDKIRKIEAELKAGYSKRSIAVRHGVSPMTVVRVAERVAERGAIQPSGTNSTRA